MAKNTTKTSRPVSLSNKRPYLKQSDVPSASLDEALRVPQAILDHYAGRPIAPLQVAKALNMDPKGSQIRVLSGAAMAFGLIEGGAQATSISLTDLARRILRPKDENEDLTAKREAVLRPRVFGDFLRQYDGNAFPRQDIALNVIEEMGVPRDKTEEVLERIDASARFVGFIEEIKGKNYVTLQGAAGSITNGETNSQAEMDLATNEEKTSVDVQRTTVPPPIVQPKGTALKAAIADDHRRRRVFITHGKNRDLVDPIKGSSGNSVGH